VVERRPSMPNVEGSNPFARFSLGNGRLCLPSLTCSGLSAFAARSQRRGSANRNGDPDFENLSSNPFAMRSRMNQGAKNIIVGRSDEEKKTNLSFFASAKMYQSNR
jgi:hypothetical protein